jgi:hypothetical protein
MKFRSLACLLALAIPLAAAAAEEAPPATPKPSLWNRLLHPFGGSKDKGSKVRGTDFKKLDVGMQVEPNPVKLGENKQVKVTLTLSNRSGKLAQLDFPTSQRIEVLINAKNGQRLLQWSEDQAFANEPTLVTINPGERLEYSVNVSTRDLAAGGSYTIEGFFPNFEQLRKSETLTAEK